MPTCTNGAFPPFSRESEWKRTLQIQSRSMFLCFGAKKKKKNQEKIKAGTFNGNLQSLEKPFPNIPELSDWHSVWTTVFTAACCSLDFSDCSSDWEETGPAELPVWTRQVQPRLETAEPRCSSAGWMYVKQVPESESEEGSEHYGRDLQSQLSSWSESTQYLCFNGGGAIEALLSSRWKRIGLFSERHGIPSVLETPFLFSSENTETKQISMIFSLNRFHF